jgi:hypothetical protein
VHDAAEAAEVVDRERSEATGGAGVPAVTGVVEGGASAGGEAEVDATAIAGVGASFEEFPAVEFAEDGAHGALDGVELFGEEGGAVDAAFDHLEDDDVGGAEADVVEGAAGFVLHGAQRSERVAGEVVQEFGAFVGVGGEGGTAHPFSIRFTWVKDRRLADIPSVG